MKGEKKEGNFLFIFLIYVSWIVIEQVTPYLNQAFDFRKIHPWLLPAIRMTLLFLVTYAYVKYYERKSFAEGFNFAFRNIGRNIMWAFVFFLVGGLVIMAYQMLVVKPLTAKVLTASSSPSAEPAKSFFHRLFEYLYIVYEGIIEVFIFIGFLYDRLARKWSLPMALIVANLAFALWHYDYWRQGWLEGSLMIVLTFLAGLITTLNYVKTKNSLSPVICHTFIDSPNSIRILLGVMP